MTPPDSFPPHGRDAEHGADDTRRGRRASRARVMIVGASDVEETLVDRLRHAPVEVGNVFEAIGELTACGADQPIIAAIVHEHADEDECAEAMRRIDPSVVLIRAVGPESPLETRGGFDEVVRLPLEAATLEPIVGRTAFLPRTNGATSAGPNGIIATKPPSAVEPEAAAATGSATPNPPVRSPLVQTTPARKSRGAEPDEVDAPAPPGAPGIIAPPPAASINPGAAPAIPAPTPVRADPSEPLGDTDLIGAVMKGDGALVETALELIRQHTRWEDVHVEANGAAGDGSAGAARVAIVEDDHAFGDLVSSRPTHAQLAPWARWLARWMDLERSYRRYRVMAYRDELTGAWNRRYFHRFLRDAIAEGAERRRPVTVMVFDIDNFKRYNDVFSHEAGDVILCETVALLKSVIRACDRVCRIGGDEFAVIFADLDEPRESGSNHPDSVEMIARRFQEQICTLRFPKLGLEAPGTLSISAGLSSYPWDGSDPATLLRLADERALESKRKGKNDITFGPGGVSLG